MLLQIHHKQRASGLASLLADDLGDIEIDSGNQNAPAPGDTTALQSSDGEISMQDSSALADAIVAKQEGAT